MRYFVSYYYASPAGSGFGNTWAEAARPITGPDDLVEIADRIRAKENDRDTTIVILNFQLITEPRTPAEAQTGRTDREAAALMELAVILPLFHPDTMLSARLRRIRQILSTP